MWNLILQHNCYPFNNTDPLQALHRSISQTVFMLSIAINGAERYCMCYCSNHT